MEIASANKGDQALYLVTCLAPCRDVGISLEVDEGDADLYARYVLSCDTLMHSFIHSSIYFCF